MTNKIIPTEVQSLLDSINGVKKEFVRIDLEDHADLPGFNQQMVITGLTVSLNRDYLKVIYLREFYKKSDGSRVYIIKECPEWVITKSNTTYLLDATYQPILIDVETTINEVTTTVKEPIRVNTINYLLYLQNKKHATLLELIELYAPSFVKENKERFNK